MSIHVDGATGPVAGTYDGNKFHPSQPWEFGEQYSVTVTSDNPQGRRGTNRATFATIVKPELVEVGLYPEGDTVGVGMPAVLWFSRSVPPQDRDALQSHLTVRSNPPVEGAWRWISDDTLHWRPRSFWPPHTTVTVTADVRGQHAGDAWFTESWVKQFTIGAQQRISIDAASHTMLASRDNQPVRSMAISTGRDAYPTASGIDLIMEKHDRFEMDSTSVGITGSEAYRLVVDNAQRLTNSGTFIHAAPWNGLLGVANISHGCINASATDAAWMMEFTQVGDPVEVLNTPEQVAYTNGWGDWNLTWEQWLVPADV